ncbi:MAG: DUF3869 domain-containing protein [Bacteroides sp.]|nr:DUF3869 domain-containing protein [Bacteroides sp.]
MKKIKFLSGLFAMAAVALATTFTACEKEELDIKFEPTPAQLQFNVTVIDMATNSVIADAQVTGAEAESNENGIAAQTRVITATKGTATGSVTINVPAIEAGKIVTYSPVIFLAEGLISEAKVSEKGAVQTKWGVAADLSHSHTDANNHVWAKNESNYLLPFTATLTMERVLTLKEKNISVSSLPLAEYIKESITMETVEKTYTGFKATAWCYYNVRFLITPATWTYTYTSVATGDVLGTAQYADPVFEVDAEQVEMEIPGHEHAYGHGHGFGHGHGDASNAGGGIVYAD